MTSSQISTSAHHVRSYLMSNNLTLLLIYLSVTALMEFVPIFVAKSEDEEDRLSLLAPLWPLFPLYAVYRVARMLRKW